MSESSDEAKMRQNVQISLATTLQELSLEFRKYQTKYLSRSFSFFLLFYLVVLDLKT